MNARIPGKVKGGLFIPQYVRNWNTALKIYEGKNVVVTISKPTKQRTNPQNNYLWGVPYKMIAAHTGDDVDSVHDAMVDMFLSTQGTVFKKKGSTSKLETEPFNEYVDKIIQWAAEFLGLYIPYPLEEEMWSSLQDQQHV